MADLQNDSSGVLLNDLIFCKPFYHAEFTCKGFLFCVNQLMSFKLTISFEGRVALEALFSFGFIMYQYVISSFLEKRTFCLSIKV